MNKRWISIIFTLVLIISYIYSCFYCPLSYAEFVKDDNPDEPKIFERNDPNIKIITSESEVEKYRINPIGTQRIIKINKVR